MERVGLIERVRLLGASNVVTLHPYVIDAYRENIEKLHTALSVDAVDPGIVTAFRNLMAPSSSSRPGTGSHTWSTPMDGCLRSWASICSRQHGQGKKSLQKKGLGLL